MQKKRIQHRNGHIKASLVTSGALHSVCPQPARCELNGVFIVLVAAAGGVVIIKVKLLATRDWCCCHIFNLYFKGCQILCVNKGFSSLLGCWQNLFYDVTISKLLHSKGVRQNQSNRICGAKNIYRIYLCELYHLQIILVFLRIKIILHIFVLYTINTEFST